MPIWRRFTALQALEFRAGAVLEQRYLVLAVRRGHGALVYLARDLQTQEPVVLKTLQPHLSVTAAVVEHFKREAETWMRLGSHPHIVQLYNVLLIADRPHIVMEHVAGQTLRQAAAALSPAAIVDCMIQVCWAMQYAYDCCTIVHGDLRPENVFITPSGAVKLSDLGLARALHSAASSQPEHARGRQARDLVQHLWPALAPEQLLPGGVVGPWSDIYAAGVLLLELLTGRRPAGASRSVEPALPQLPAPADLGALAPELPAAHAYIISRCLEHDLARRYSSFAALEHDLQLLRQHQLGSRLEPSRQVLMLGQAAHADHNGSARFALGEYETALEWFRQAVQAEPRRAVYWLHLGMAQSALLRCEEALRSFERAAAVQPSLDEQIELWRLRGETYERLYNLPQALQAYQQILALDRRQRAGWLGLARLFVREARFREAHEAYCEGLKLVPHDPALWLGRAQVEQLFGRHKQALQCFDEVLKRTPHEASAWCGKASALAALQRYKEALVCYQTACGIDPHMAEAQAGVLACQRMLDAT